MFGWLVGLGVRDFGRWKGVAGGWRVRGEMKTVYGLVAFCECLAERCCGLVVVQGFDRVDRDMGTGFVSQLRDQRVVRR